MSPRFCIPGTLSVAFLFSAPALAQQAQEAQEAQDTSDLEARMDELEEKNRQLESQLEAVSSQMETIEFQDVMPPIGDSKFGMGRAASKIYGQDRGVSIGGYGEAIYSAPAGSETATSDFLRAIIYVGYKFDDKWVFNSEIEVEHGNEIAVEFAYLEYMQSDAFNFRAGMLLVPMGWVNEMHEPTAFRGPTRPFTEQRVLPSTWRETGLGMVGSVSDFTYKLYAMNGFDATGFDETGLRGGRQKGSTTKAEDIAFVGRLDWAPGNGLNIGTSLYYGDSGQGDPTLGNATTTIFDLHGEYRRGGLQLRGLFAQAAVDDTETLFAGNGNKVVGERQTGWYVEAGYDVASAFAPDSGHQVIPYMRYEAVDTQAQVAASLTPDPAQKDNVITMGIDWKPIQNIVFKAAYLDWDNSTDALQLSLGYVF